MYHLCSGNRKCRICLIDCKISPNLIIIGITGQFRRFRVGYWCYCNLWLALFELCYGNPCHDRPQIGHITTISTTFIILRKLKALFRNVDIQFNNAQNSCQIVCGFVINLSHSFTTLIYVAIVKNFGGAR